MIVGNRYYTSEQNPIKDPDNCHTVNKIGNKYIYLSDRYRPIKCERRENYLVSSPGKVTYGSPTCYYTREQWISMNQRRELERKFTKFRMDCMTSYGHLNNTDNSSLIKMSGYMMEIQEMISVILESGQ